MIKILYDHQIFSEQRYGGISRYFANLCREINIGSIGKVKIAVDYVKNYYLSFYPQPMNNWFGRWLLRKAHKRYRWNEKYSIKHLKEGNFDVFHATYYHTYYLPYLSKPMVITIHDMIHENSPEMFADSAIIIERKKLLMEAATKIIAISNFTADEIVKHYPQFKHKIERVYHGISSHFVEQGNEKLPAERFLLFVGERGNYKNFVPMINAIAPLLLQQADLRLICAGGKSFTPEEQKLLETLGVTNQCIQIDASDKTLAQLYQQAIVFIYPSAQEGFGLPILEAFQQACVVACSDKSCLPEIGGDAVQYFDPENDESILQAIEAIIADPAYAQQLKEKGTARLEFFSMEKCVANTLEVYQSIK